MDRRDDGLTIVLGGLTQPVAAATMRMRGIVCFVMAGVLAVVFGVTGGFVHIASAIVLAGLVVAGALQFFSALHLQRSKAIVDVVREDGDGRGDERGDASGEGLDEASAGLMLLITQTGFMEKRQRSWRAEAVRAIAAERNRTLGMAGPAWQLAIRRADGYQDVFFVEFDERTLRWLAATVSEALGVADESEAKGE